MKRAMWTAALAALVATSPGFSAGRLPLEETDVADDFTMAAGGDVIISKSVAVSPQNRDIFALLRNADVAMANLEVPIVDIRSNRLLPVNNGNFLTMGPPEAAPFLKDLGFDLMGFANNHTLNWGADGARETVRRLDEVGIGLAGFGENRSSARAPVGVTTPKGRVALVSFTASFFAGNVAADPLGVIPGVPGVSALRTKRYDIVTRDQFDVLRAIDDQHNPGAVFQPGPAGDELIYRGLNFRVGDKPDTVYQMNAEDEADILRNIRQAKQRSDFLIATMHNHEEPGCEQPIREGDGSAWRCIKPADFVIQIARAAIDNGADAFVGHGAHVLQGIEIYKGRPIFYSLGNLFSDMEGVTQIRDAYPAAMDAKRDTAPEYLEKMWAYYKQDTTMYHSVVAVSRYRANRLAEVRLYPIDLGLDRRQADRGPPETASPALAQKILKRLQSMSEPFGTVISIEGNIGVIRIPAASR